MIRASIHSVLSRGALGVLAVLVSVSPLDANDIPRAQMKSDAYDAGVPKPTLAGIRYGENERHVLDFWQAKSSEPTPLVFVIHGGGWKGGSKERVKGAIDIDALLEAGISVIAINYRLINLRSPDTEPPVKAPLRDAARALQFVRSRAREWNIDKTRIGAAGASAGGCSSLWLAFHDDLADPQSDDPVARESTRLMCAAVSAAQTTLDPVQMRDWMPGATYGGHAFGFADFEAFLAVREKILPWIVEYSPYALVSADDPGIYMIYRAAPAVGQKQRDSTHSCNFGVKLREHCALKGVSAELVYPGAPMVKHATPTDFLISTLQLPSRKDARSTP